MSPTARSLAHLRELGYKARVVEKWNPWAKVRQDLFGGDLIGLKPGEPVLVVLGVVVIIGVLRPKLYLKMLRTNTHTSRRT
jgi:hypothetical protein